MSSLSILRKLLGLILVPVCAGCVPVPVPVGAFSTPPFSRDVLQKLSRQDADKKLVRQELGSPKAIKAGGRYWFYASSRESLGFIGADVVFRDYEWVTVQFDDADRVVFLEYSDDRDGCLSNGICQSAGLFSTEPATATITAPAAQDTAARSYRPHPDECAVYLFLERLPPLLMAGSVRFSIDGRPRGIVDDEAYLFLTHPAGEIRISAYQLGIGTKCTGGEKLYVKAEKALDWSWETGKDLSPVDAAEGEAAIRSRRLALPD